MSLETSKYRYRLVIHKEDHDYLNVGTYDSREDAEKIAAYFPDNEPAIYFEEVTLSDFVELIQKKEECDVEAAIYEAVLTHNLADTNEDIYECYMEYGLEMDEDARRRLLA